MNFAIVIHGDPSEDTSLERALGFARAALAAGHEIYRVFLYHEAVRIAHNQYQARPDLIDAWQDLADKYRFELTACVSAADRRGVQSNHGTLREGFVIVGLGQFADCLLNADRTITFRS